MWTRIFGRKHGYDGVLAVWVRPQKPHLLHTEIKHMAKRVIVLVFVAVLAIVLMRHAASFLVLNSPQQSDVILVLAGDNAEPRYWHAVELLKADDAKRIVVDLETRRVRWGVSDLQLAAHVLQETMPGKSEICPTTADSTYSETEDSAKCLAPLNPRSVLLVTSDYHTRRASAIYRARLPQYRWSVAATPEPYDFGTKWWTRRPWAKTTLEEWEKLLWWELVDRWRAHPIAN